MEDFRPLSSSEYRSLSKTDWAKLTPNDVGNMGVEKEETLLHIAAGEGLWDCLPNNLKDKKYWKETSNGTTIYMYAATSPDLSWIDPKDLTEDELLKKNDNGDSVLSLSIKHGNFGKLVKQVSKKNLTKRLLTEKTKAGDSIIHAIARYKQIKEVPKHLLTEEILSLKTTSPTKESVYHILAKEGMIKDLPKELLTPKGLSLKDKSGVTPLLSMAQNEPYLIPKELLTTEFMLQKQAGDIPLTLWALGPHWKEIPLELITEKSVKALDPAGYSLLNISYSLLNIIVDQYHKERFWDNIKPENVKKMNDLFNKALKMGCEKELLTIKNGLKNEPWTTPKGMKLTSTLIQEEITKKRLMEQLKNNEMSFEL